MNAADIAAASDGVWFEDNPKRRYRVRAGQIVRRCSGVHLRVADPSTTPDIERDAEATWWLIAWPNIPPETRDAMKRQARRVVR